MTPAELSAYLAAEIAAFPGKTSLLVADLPTGAVRHAWQPEEPVPSASTIKVPILLAALEEVCRYLSRAIAGDGEGASRLITCAVREARSEESAERLAKAVVGSPLVKAAMFGADTNWGRVLCAMGYSKAPFRPEHVDVSFCSQAGSILVCKQGDGVDFDEDKAKTILTEKEVIIDVDLHEGDESAECWGCDLTYDYVKINGDYRT